MDPATPESRDDWKRYPQSRALNALLFLAVLYTLYFASSIMIPISIALLVSL